MYENHTFYQAEIGSILKAMKKIEEKTCIRFHRIDPEPGKDWLLLMRVGRAGSTCYADYINQNLKNRNFGDLGKVCSSMSIKLDFYYPSKGF